MRLDDPAIGRARRGLARHRRAPRGLLQLAELLRSQAARNGCHQSALPFHPHITLLRAATSRWRSAGDAGLGVQRRLFLI